LRSAKIFPKKDSTNVMPIRLKINKYVNKYSSRGCNKTQMDLIKFVDIDLKILFLLIAILNFVGIKLT
jgi:hypothetical protein